MDKSNCVCRTFCKGIPELSWVRFSRARMHSSALCFTCGLNHSHSPLWWPTWLTLDHQRRVAPDQRSAACVTGTGSRCAGWYKGQTLHNSPVYFWVRIRSLLAAEVCSTSTLWPGFLGLRYTSPALSHSSDENNTSPRPTHPYVSKTRQQIGR